MTRGQRGGNPTAKRRDRLIRHPLQPGPAAPSRPGILLGFFHRAEGGSSATECYVGGHSFRPVGRVPTYSKYEKTGGHSISGIGPYVARPRATRGMLRTELQRLAPGSAVAALVLGLVLILFPTAAGASGPWSITSSPNQGTKANVLEGVSCTSAGTFCKAVGYYTTSGNVERTLIETWNGTSWTVDTSPNVGASTNWLVSVSCLSATWCQAVGFSQSTSSSPQHTLVEFWNGTAWTVHSSPNKGASNNDLYGVWCVSTTSCKAVGPYYNGTYYEALIESWNGTSWTISSAPSVGAKGSVLNTVSCVSATACKAAGDLTNHEQHNKDPHRVVEWHRLVGRSESERWDGGQPPLWRLMQDHQLLQGRRQRPQCEQRAANPRRILERHCVDGRFESGPGRRSELPQPSLVHFGQFMLGGRWVLQQRWDQTNTD